MAESLKPTVIGTPADQPVTAEPREEARKAVILLASKNRLSLKSLIDTIQPDLSPYEENELSHQVTQWFSELVTKLKATTEVAPAPDLGIQPTLVEGCLVPPGEGSMPKGNGSNPDSEPFGPRQTHPRIELAIETLRSLGATDLEWFRGENEKGMLRMLGYNALVSKKLEKAVLVCNAEGNRTFVIHNLSQVEALWKLNKSELMAKVSTGELTDLLWQEPKDWKRKLGEMIDPAFVPPQIKRPRDKAYYTDPESVKADLETYAKCLGEGKTPFDLSCSNTSRFRIKCSNGEIGVLWSTWLRNAAVSLGKAKTARALDSILKIAGYEILDEAYFADPKKIKQDLESIASIYKIEIETLNVANFRGADVLCTNGETISGRIWLTRAAIALGMATDAKEAESLMTETLDDLKQKIGINVPERKEYPPMDSGYFENVENIQFDLQAIAKASGCQTIQELGINKMNKRAKNVTYSNGETFHVTTYLRRAAVGMGIVRVQTEAGSFGAETLRKLKEKIGIVS